MKGLFDRAISELDRAVGLATNAGDRALALSNRAAAYVDKATWDFDAYVNEGRYETLAVRDANEAVQLQPNNPFIFNTRALAYVKARQYGWAAADYRRAIALIPTKLFLYQPRLRLSPLGTDRSRRSGLSRRACPECKLSNESAGQINAQGTYSEIVSGLSLLS